MKTILLSLLVFSFSPQLMQAASAITADDIARHLGITIWKFDQNTLPPKFSASIVEIKDGKVIGDYVSPAIFSFSGDLVISASDSKEGLRVSMGVPETTVRNLENKNIGFGACLTRPKFLLDQPILLAGNFRKKVGAETEAVAITNKIEDVASGIALVVREILPPMGVFTPWMNNKEMEVFLDPLGKKDANNKNFWDRGHWLAAVEGRWESGRPQFRLKIEKSPKGKKLWWFWWFNQDQESYNKHIHRLSDEGFVLVSDNSFEWPDGSRRFSGVWHKVE
ncbi:hypothetical protein [Geminisphaera colitermitum]|uniref:hypothetical protein n=1 Tax=Geminisphaera colitermitum TaxID=1148786 RepID=UPI000158C51F|nr:hypothetical protein [Geminisphaera colitermitum]